MSRQYLGGQAGGTLADSTPVVVPLKGASLPLSVWVNPAAGDTVTVEYQPGPMGPWIAWPNGAATAYSVAVLDAPANAIRFTRSAGAGTTSRYGIE